MKTALTARIRRAAVAVRGECASIWNNVQTSYALQRMELTMFPDVEVPPRWFMYVEAVRDGLKWWWAEKLCQIFGHQWQDCGSLHSANSGSDSYHCTRCGRSWHYTYY